MRRVLLVVLGVGIGYVLGARAGRDRYDQLAAWASRLMRRSPSSPSIPSHLAPLGERID